MTELVLQVECNLLRITLHSGESSTPHPTSLVRLTSAITHVRLHTSRDGLVGQLPTRSETVFQVCAIRSVASRKDYLSLGRSE